MRKTLAGRGVVRESVLTRAALGLAACALTAFVYMPFIESPFVLDDRSTVLLNPSLVDAFDWRGILLGDPWHPLVTLTLALDRAFWGFSSIGFHITNGVLHVAVVALLFGLCTRLFDDHWTAFIAAASFGVNPLTARSAAYVSARADLLFTAGLFVVLILARRAVARSSRAGAALAGVAAAITLTALPWGTAAHGPRRLYLLVAILTIAAARAIRDLVIRYRLVRVAGVLAVAALLVITQRALVRWTDPVELWRQEVARSPDAWDAHLGYADALREASHCSDAAVEYRDALQLNPQLEDARRGLAVCRGR
jgi:hypothetical protein